MYEKNKTTELKMSSSKCSCCPYGFHIDRDFVRYCDSLYNSAQLDKLRQHKRERRKEKKSVESYLGLGCLSLEHKNIPNPVIRQNSTPSLNEKSKEFYVQSDDLTNAVNDFEDTWKRSLKKSSGRHDVDDRRNGIKQSDSLVSTSGTVFDSSLSSVNSEDIKENKFSLHASRSSSSSSVSSHSTSHSHAGLLPVSDDSCSSIFPGMHTSLSKPLNSVPFQTVGISTSVLTNIRQQMASSLHRMKELEEQVKYIPVLKVKISTLSEEKKSLLNELRVKESMISEVKHSKNENELEKQLKKLENEGIMSPTLSRKCLSYRHRSDSLFSPAIASSLDATMIKKSFIQNKIISHLKIDDSSDSLDSLKSRKSIGTSCSVLTRDIGVGYVPNKFKSIAVGNDFSQNEYINLSRRSHFEKQPSVSSESLESDPDSWSGVGDIPRFSSDYRPRDVSMNKVFVENNSSKSFVDSSTNTQLHFVHKCVGTVKECLFDTNKVTSVEKTVRNKSVSVSPSVINKKIQVSNKHAIKHIGSQTLEDKVKDTYEKKIRSHTHDIGVGDFVISDETCDNCKKSRKSVGVGDFNINNVICKKCLVNTTLFQSIGIGEFDVNISCEKCQEKIVIKEKDFAVCSVGTNTTFDLNASNNSIHICDKCSEAIHSVAHDLAADSSGTSSSKINSNIVKEQACKSKLSKLKFEKPPKLEGINSERSLSLAGTENVTEISSERSRSKIITDEKDDKNLNTDTDSTETSLSSEILPHFTNLPVIPRKKNELNKEVKAACKVLNDHLQKADHANEKKTLSSLKIIQNEWFKAANQKKADPHLIEDYIDAFEEFSKLLLHKIVNLSDSNGNSALHYAVSYGNFDVVSILIDSKVCDVNLKNKAGYTSIMLVALAEVRNDTHCYVVQRLFSIGDINIKATQNGQTALMLAVSHGKKDIVRILLDVGAEVNLQDKDGSTALMCAAEHGHLELAKLLLAHPECDPTIVDNDGCTALTIAMEAGHKDIGLLIYTNMNFSRGSSPYSTLKSRKRSTPRSTPPPHTPTLRTPPLPSPATKSMNSLTSFHFPT